MNRTYFAALSNGIVEKGLLSPPTKFPASAAGTIGSRSWLAFMFKIGLSEVFCWRNGNPVICIGLAFWKDAGLMKNGLVMSGFVGRRVPGNFWADKWDF